MMLICCDIPFSRKTFSPRFRFLRVSMAFLKETAPLNGINRQYYGRARVCGGGRVAEGRRTELGDTCVVIFLRLAYRRCVLTGFSPLSLSLSLLHVFISLSLSGLIPLAPPSLPLSLTCTLTASRWQLQIWLPI